MEENNYESVQQNECDNDNDDKSVNEMNSAVDFNAITALNLNKYTDSIYRYYSMISTNKSYLQKYDGVLYFIEIFQLVIYFFQIKFASIFSQNIRLIMNIFLLNLPFNNNILIMNIISWIFILFLFGCFALFAIGNANSFGKVPKPMLMANVIVTKLVFGPLIIPMLYNFLNMITQALYMSQNKYLFLFEGVLGIILLLLHSVMTSCYFVDYIPLNKNSFKKMSTGDIQNIQTFAIVIEYLNFLFIEGFLKSKLLSIGCSFIIVFYLWYKNLTIQPSYSMKINSINSSIYFSILLVELEGFIFELIKLNNGKSTYIIYCISAVIFFIVGWFINMHYYKFKVNKIINKITKKYNQQKIINEMKRDLEEKHDAELMNKSLETIVTNKRIKKKEKCFSDYREASFLCKFIMYNRSPESFLLIEKIFKECVSEFPRNPYIYLDFWNHLHGILLFVSRNKKFYPDSQSIADDIHVMSNRILYKVCNLEINFKIKYLIYNASHCYELEKEKFKRKDNANETSNDDLDLGYEVEMVKNIAINYHVKSIVSIKNMINELKNYNSPRDVDNILIMNDELSDILSKAEKYYAVYVNKFSFSREAILLYVAFLRNILIKPDVADEYLKNIEYEYEDEKDNNDKKSCYEKSEGTSTASTLDYKRLKMIKNNMENRFQRPIREIVIVMQIFMLIFITMGIICNYENREVFNKLTNGLSDIHTGFQSAYVVSRVKYDIRLTSLGLVTNNQDVIDYYMDDLKTNFQFLETRYVPNIYKRHSIKPLGFHTVKPINNDVVDEINDENYYLNIVRLYNNARLYLEKFNKTTHENPLDLLNEPLLRYFKANSNSKFGPIFMKAVDLVVADNIKSINRLLRFIYIVLAVDAFIEIVIIFGVIIPSSNKCIETLKGAFTIFKYIPKENMDEIIDSFDSQLLEIYEKNVPENEHIAVDDLDKKKKNKKCKAVNMKFKLIGFSIFVGLIIIMPFLIIMLFKNECVQLLHILSNMGKRDYYANSVGLMGLESMLHDTATFGKLVSGMLGERASILQSYDSKIKSGYYGNIISGFDIFRPFLGKPGCVRPERFQYQCESDSRKNKTIYDDVYTEELANSNINYIMTEYIKNVNEFVSNVDTSDKEFPTSVEELSELLEKIENDTFMKFHNKVIFDISGHTLRYTEIAKTYLVEKVQYLLKVAYITHMVVSVIIMCVFLTFIMKQIREQMNVMRVLTNIIFTIPLPVFKSVPKLQNFIETGKII